MQGEIAGRTATAKGRDACASSDAIIKRCALKSVLVGCLHVQVNVAEVSVGICARRRQSVHLSPLQLFTAGCTAMARSGRVSSDSCKPIEPLRRLLRLWFAQRIPQPPGVHLRAFVRRGADAARQCLKGNSRPPAENLQGSGTPPNNFNCIAALSMTTYPPACRMSGNAAVAAARGRQRRRRRGRIVQSTINGRRPPSTSAQHRSFLSRCRKMCNRCCGSIITNSDRHRIELKCKFTEGLS